MKIRNPFHRATAVEKQEKSLKNLKREKRSLNSQVRQTDTEIRRLAAKKVIAMRNNDFETAKEAVFERKKLEANRGQLKGNQRAVDDVARTVRNVKTQIVMDQSVKNAHKAMMKSIKNMGDADKTMEKLEDVREKIEQRNEQMDEMHNTLGIQGEVDAEMDDEIRQMAEQMGHVSIAPIQQAAAPVYEENAPIAEEN